MKELEKKILCMLVIMSTVRETLKKWTTDSGELTDAELSSIFNDTTFSLQSETEDFLENLESIYANILLVAAKKGYDIQIK